MWGILNTEVRTLVRLLFIVSRCVVCNDSSSDQAIDDIGVWVVHTTDAHAPSV